MPSLNLGHLSKTSSKRGKFEREPGTAATNIVESATIGYTLKNMTVEYLY